MSEIDRLVKKIEKHNYLYWNLGSPEISDVEYDNLLRKLESLDPEHPLLKQIYSPKAGSKGKIRHKKPMLSLEKAYSLQELKQWANKHARSENETFLVQPKYDGISANFADGILASRGDGLKGEDITPKNCLVELETKSYNGPLDRPVRGEIVIRDDDFKNIYSKIKRKDGKTYKNSRNAVAGIVGLKDIGEMRNQGAKLTLVDYNLYSYKLKLNEFDIKWPDLLEKIESLPYPMDGIVVKIADEDYSESLGSTAHHPRGQIAFKFTAIREKSRILDIKWSFGKNCLTPVAELEAVEIGGVTIKHASLHNFENILKKDVHIGDIAVIERAGDVIPYIVSSKPGKNRKSAVINNCPSCGTELERRGPELRCPNPECPETKVKKLLSAVKNIGIERLGEPNIRRMMDTLGVSKLGDIFSLQVKDIMKLDGFKLKSSQNLYREIQNARKVEDYKLLASLNIANIGKNLAVSILTQYSLDELRKLDFEQLSEIDGVGPERAKALKEELLKQSEIIDELSESVDIIKTKGDSNSAQTICFTGKMSEKRSYYADTAEKNGYRSVDAVNSDLSLLVCADKNIKSSKIKKAEKFNIKILELDEWLKKINSKTSESENINHKSEDHGSDEFNDLPLFS